MTTMPTEAYKPYSGPTLLAEDMSRFVFWCAVHDAPHYGRYHGHSRCAKFANVILGPDHGTCAFRKMEMTEVPE